MCGDVMINKNKTKTSSSKALVMSMIMAVLLSLMRQSLQPRDDTYASTRDTLMSSDMHGAALDRDGSYGNAWVQQIMDHIQQAVDEQKKTFDRYVMWQLFGDIVTGSSLQTWSKSVPSVVPIVSLPVSQDEYVSFSQLQQDLANKHCDYTLPIDIADIKGIEHIQWWLDHCLITVSAAQKVYPNDILTHEMMRTIARRAGFVVKMEFASRQPVLRNQLLVFMDAIQQHHRIGDIPAVATTNPVTRIQYITLLHKLFGPSTEKDRKDQSVVISTGATSDAITTGSTMTVKAWKEILKTQWVDIPITSYDDTIVVTPDIIKKILSDTDYNKKITSDLGIDKEMLKQTVSWMMEKL